MSKWQKNLSGKKKDSWLSSDKSKRGARNNCVPLFFAENAQAGRLIKRIQRIVVCRGQILLFQAFQLLLAEQVVAVEQLPHLSLNLFRILQEAMTNG